MWGADIFENDGGYIFLVDIKGRQCFFACLSAEPVTMSIGVDSLDSIRAISEFKRLPCMLASRKRP